MIGTNMAVTKQKFSSQADPETLEAMKAIAAKEGRQFQAILDEAMRDYIERKTLGRPRPHIMEALGRSMREYDSLYDKLAR